MASIELLKIHCDKFKILVIYTYLITSSKSKMAFSTIFSCFPPMGSSMGFISQRQILRSQIAWSRPLRTYITLQGLANDNNYATSANRSSQWQHLDRPLLWQGSETAALQAGGLPSKLSPPWKVFSKFNL
jgi:hypothetical protein